MRWLICYTCFLFFIHIEIKCRKQMLQELYIGSTERIKNMIVVVWPIKFFVLELRGLDTLGRVYRKLDMGSHYDFPFAFLQNKFPSENGSSLFRIDHTSCESPNNFWQTNFLRMYCLKAPKKWKTQTLFNWIFLSVYWVPLMPCISSNLCLFFVEDILRLGLQWNIKPNYIPITKTHLFKYTETFTTKKRKFSDKKFWYFSYFCSKHRLWVLVRTASTRRF